MQRDSVYIRDSIYVREKGDTVYMERCDSIRVEKPVYIEKPRRWYETGLMWALFLYLKRKF